LAQQDEVARRYPWAGRIIRRWLVRWPRYHDEILSAMHWGLCKGVQRYDPAKSDDEERFLVVAIFTQVRRDLRQLERQRSRIPTNPINDANPHPQKKPSLA
jgi:DNA-directed RNA polymerase specialized sigma subunit